MISSRTPKMKLSALIALSVAVIGINFWGNNNGPLLLDLPDTQEATAYDDAYTTPQDVTLSVASYNWEPQGASNCSDAYGAFDAFMPGMRGHGSCNRGGFVPNTNVIVVNTLSADGAGSIREALLANCPKVILFAVEGLINYEGTTANSGITSNRCDHWSVVGASAPGNVTLTGSINTTLVGTGSHWTVDHLTIAAGDTGINPSPNTGNRDSIAFEQATDATNVVVMNNNFIWGADETVQCYMGGGDGTRDFSDILYWQNFIGIHVGGSGVHIIQNTCRNNASIRNTYFHANGRSPLVRGNGYFHANNVTGNYGYNASQIQVCADSGYPPYDSVVQMQYINNFYVAGPNSGGRDVIYFNKGSDGGAATALSCSNGSVDTFNLHERGTRKMTTSQTLVDCSNNACVQQVDGGGATFVSEISPVYPDGYVPETITNTQAGVLEYTNKIIDHSGARPLSRLSYMAQKASEVINMVDGTGDVGGWLPESGFPTSGNTTTAAEGGISVITPSGTSTRNPLTQCPTHPGRPGGPQENIVQSGSGLTGLHEWVIECFYDSVMPTGYREAL